jgi:hypothetical protein
MAETPRPVTPLTALVVNADGQLTYMGQDGQRYVIVGNSEVLEAWNQDKDQDKKQDNGS